ncbi:uncharacterized protein [Montipora capricornis]|uniref:uncharacterized protein n=1 Tax=Montipora capricornis TaxID=246305 RepID=UPI0035F1E618
MTRLLLLLCVVAAMFFISHSRPAEKRSEPDYLLDVIDKNDMKEINPDEAEKRKEEPELMDNDDKEDKETDLDARRVLCFRKCFSNIGQRQCFIICNPFVG